MEGENRDYVILIILLVSSEVLLFVCILLYRQHTTCRKKRRGENIWTVARLWLAIAAIARLLYAGVYLSTKKRF